MYTHTCVECISDFLLLVVVYVYVLGGSGAPRFFVIWASSFYVLVVVSGFYVSMCL